VIGWSDALRVPEPVGRFVNLLPAVPAVLLDRHFDVLAASRLARAVEPRLTDGENVVRLGVLAVDGGAQQPGIHAELAGLLRDSVDRYSEDDRYIAIIGELVATSRGFAQAWAEEPNGRPSGTVELALGATGPMRLIYVHLPLEGVDGQSLLLGRAADPESRYRLEQLDATSP
jgi:hypothetical protein